MRHFTLLSVAAFLTYAASASAVTFNFSAFNGIYGTSSSFTDNGGSPNSFSFTEGGIGVTVTAFSADSGGIYSANVTRDPFILLPPAQLFGLGVDNDEESIIFIGDSDSHALDDFDLIDFLLFTFDRAVNINSYRLYDPLEVGNDSMWLAGVGLSELNIAIPLPNASLENLTNVGAMGVDSILIAAHSSEGEGDRFTVKYMDVDAVPDTGATIAIFSLGILGLVGIRRRFAG